LAFFVKSEADLRKFAKVPGASGVEEIDEPGGGKRVRIDDPHGYQMEVVWGMKQSKPLKTRENVLNWVDKKIRRAGELMRLPRGPSQVKRIAHAVIMAQQATEKIKWYREMFGFVLTDEVYAGPKDNVIFSFNRCDRGETYVDHHTLLCIEGPKVGLNHISFEVQNFDDVMLGHEHLQEANKYKHVWGIGRHVLGSQIFDYWQDPWNRVHEHWTDTDMLNIHYKSKRVAAEEGLNSQWGEPVPHELTEHATP
jgi:Glyoxalase/Bleomycin resistance protein/Dioxygenase superfamily